MTVGDYLKINSALAFFKIIFLKKCCRTHYPYTVLQYTLGNIVAIIYKDDIKKKKINGKNAVEHIIQTLGNIVAIIFSITCKFARKLLRK